MRTSQSGLPSLFGRATVVHGEHAGLIGLAERLRRWCRSPRDGAESPAQYDAHLAEFSAQLVLHFESEESPSYFGAVLEECPWLEGGISTLKQEHRRMNAMLEALQAVAEARWSDEFAACVVELIDRLEAHEKRERVLLHEFFEAR